MALLAGFIGVDLYLDQSIRELTGCRRDAEALWALFSDSIPDIQAKLITNEDATVDAIRQIFHATLGAATSSDTVVLSFSGHGTSSHQIVAYDTSRVDPANTTIPMDELARYFKETQAQAVLFILDCCFSGGAPAKVLSDIPVSRNIGISLSTLAGEGSILLAASMEDEEAYEVPGGGHGVLTKAVIDTFIETSSSIDLIKFSAQVVERARSVANKMGVVQTPVMFGHVKGGLVLPPIQPGQCFYDKFPRKKGLRVDDNIHELVKFGLPQTILTRWAKQFTTLNGLQLQAVNDYRILEGNSLLVIAPTGSGKTFVGELAATNAICEGRKAVFLLPYRALTNEKYEQFSQIYGDGLSMRVVRCCGDYVDQTDLFVRGKYDLALLTYEMFLNLVISNKGVLNQLGLIVLDEAQFITDPTRGISVELLLTYLLSVKQRGFNLQLITLSAVVGDVNHFDEWLGCDKLVTHQRPVPLIEGVLDRSGMFQFVDADGNQQMTQLLSPEEVQIRKKKPGSQDVIVPLIRKLVQQDENVIVFRNQKGPAQGCANYLAKDLALPPATEAIAALPKHDLPTTSVALRECLNGGTAFHNRNLTREEKEVVEQAFRDPDGQVRVLSATTTIAAGINTPASTVILAEHKFIGGEGRLFTVAEYKNMAGRAGRPGYTDNAQGQSILLASHSIERQDLFHHYILGQLEPIQSSFDSQNLKTWIVRLLAQGERVLRNEIVGLLSNTFGGYLANRLDPSWQDRMKQHLEDFIKYMIGLDLIEQEGGYIQLTLLGRAVGESALSFDSALRLIDLIRSIQTEDLSVITLMALLQQLPESDGGYTPMMKKGQKEAVRPQEAAERYGVETVQLLQKLARDMNDYYARCKRAALLWDWVHGKAIDEIEKRYTSTPYQGKIGYGDIQKFADSTRFHLRSAHQLASLIRIGKSPSEGAVEAMLQQLEVGIPADALDLLSLPLRLSRGEYMVLFNSGFLSAEDIWNSSESKVAELLGEKRAFQLSTLRPSKKH